MLMILFHFTIYWGGYYSLGTNEYLLGHDVEKSFGHIYLGTISYIKAFSLWNAGEEVKNRSVENKMKKGLNTERIAYSAIAVNEYELALEFSRRSQIIHSMLIGDYQKAKQLVLALPDSPDESKEIYYICDRFLKSIYLAILEQNEVMFNEELIKRIKKYRKKPLGYATYIDVVSISMIKFARKLGINFYFNVIEIPPFFLDENNRVDQNIFQLPNIVKSS